MKMTWVRIMYVDLVLLSVYCMIWVLNLNAPPPPPKCLVSAKSERGKHFWGHTNRYGLHFLSISTVTTLMNFSGIIAMFSRDVLAAVSESITPRLKQRPNAAVKRLLPAPKFSLSFYRGSGQDWFSWWSVLYLFSLSSSLHTTKPDYWLTSKPFNQVLSLTQFPLSGIPTFSSNVSLLKPHPSFKARLSCDFRHQHFADSSGWHSSFMSFGGIIATHTSMPCYIFSSVETTHSFIQRSL